MKQFIIRHIRSLSKGWTLIEGPNIQDCLIAWKGKPGVAVFAHMDTTGFTARYENQLVPIGSPDIGDGSVIVGEDSLGIIECEVKMNEKGRLYHNFGRPVDRGTTLVYKPDYSESQSFIRSPYLDNRLGIYVALHLLENWDNGMLVFSCWEEAGGGSVPYLAKIMYEDYKIHQALISDVTWITDGVSHGAGTVISLRDRNIPRRSFIEHIVSLAGKTGIDIQLEVEGEGSSDGGEIQRSPYPIDWAFIGPPVENTHSAREKVHKKDIISTLNIYQVLTQYL